MPYYATTKDLQDYLGATTALPQDAARLLARASEDVEACLTADPNLENLEVAAVLRQATCAQIELWMHTDESHAILGAQGLQKIGDLEFRAAPQLAPRAKRLLLRAGLGLLYRGVALRYRRSSPYLAETFFDPQLNPQKRY